MQLYELFTLISAAFAGSAMGSFLLLTIIYKPLIAEQFNHDQKQFIYRRFYRLNSVLCLLGGLTAALIKNQQASLFLVIIAVSYVFTNMHVLKGINSHAMEKSTESQRALRMLLKAQNLIHFIQFMALGYAIYLLNKPI